MDCGFVGVKLRIVRLAICKGRSGLEALDRQSAPKWGERRTFVATPATCLRPALRKASFFMGKSGQ